MALALQLWEIDVEISIREAANKLEGESIKRKIGNYKYTEGPDFIALEVKYHECKTEYLNKVRNTNSNSTLEQPCIISVNQLSKTSIIYKRNSWSWK